MKKIILATLIILNLALLSACGNNTTNTTNPPTSPDTNTVSDSTAPADTTPTADITTPTTDTTAQNNTAKKPGIPDQAAPTDNTKASVDAEVNSILQDIKKEEDTTPPDTTDTTNTVNQPTVNTPPDAGTTVPQQ
jgi:LAS superfamily LD-carboxypeptidase LdcB